MPSFKAFAEFQKKAQEAAAGPKAAAVPSPTGTAQRAVTAATPTPVTPHAPVSTPVASSKEGAAAVEGQEGGALRLGMKVSVCGLQARPELNGLVGTLTHFDDTRGRWQVDLINGGGSKLFKAANLQQHITDDDALNILKGASSAPAVRGPRPAGAMGAQVSTHPTDEAAQKAPAASETQGSSTRAFGQRLATSDGPSVAAVAAAKSLAQGQTTAEADVSSSSPTVPGGTGPEDEQDDEEAFIRSIEQCLKECDVMWDDY